MPNEGEDELVLKMIDGRLGEFSQIQKLQLVSKFN